jgi:hypothetical protein
LIWTASKIWEGDTCFILGGGTSLTRVFNIPKDVVFKVHSKPSEAYLYSPLLQSIHNKHVIGVNNAYMFGSWVDCCFFGDCSWYAVHRHNLAKFLGLKVTCCPRFLNKTELDSEGIKYLVKDRGHRLGISNDPTKVSWNHNSGAAAISLAVHFGVKRIVLIGFDMKLSSDQVSHWHKSHEGKKSPPFSRHLQGFNAIAEDAKNLGVEILNANLDSAITQFRKVSLEEVL